MTTVIRTSDDDGVRVVTLARPGRRNALTLAGLDELEAAVTGASQPVIYLRIDGPARGGGVELALACDLRIATPEATFAEPGVTLGLFGAWGGTVRLPRIVGEGEALELALSGRTVDAEAALRMGLVSRVTDDPRSVADELAANDPETLRLLRARMRDDSSPEVQERREAEVFGRLVERHADEIAETRES